MTNWLRVSASVRAQPSMLFLGDGSSGFWCVFGPYLFGQNRVGDEAGFYCDCLDRLEVDRGGSSPIIEKL